jgi:hypothetical protein
LDILVSIKVERISNIQLMFQDNKQLSIYSDEVSINSNTSASIRLINSNPNIFKNKIEIKIGRNGKKKR